MSDKGCPLCNDKGYYGVKNKNGLFTQKPCYGKCFIGNCPDLGLSLKNLKYVNIDNINEWSEEEEMRIRRQIEIER